MSFSQRSNVPPASMANSATTCSHQAAAGSLSPETFSVTAGDALAGSASFTPETFRVTARSQVCRRCRSRSLQRRRSRCHFRLVTRNVLGVRGRQYRPAVPFPEPRIAILVQDYALPALRAAGVRAPHEEIAAILHPVADATRIRCRLHARNRRTRHCAAPLTPAYQPHGSVSSAMIRSASGSPETFSVTEGGPEPPAPSSHARACAPRLLFVLYLNNKSLFV